MPAIEVSVQFGFSTRDGLEAWDPVIDPAAEAGRLTATLTGGAKDALILDQIASLQSDAGLTNAATETRARAVRIAREALLQHPDDSRTQAWLGWVLGWKGVDEADRLIRAAAARAPEDPVCQVILGRWLMTRIFNEDQVTKPSEESRRLARTHGMEARAAFDQAVAVAPADIDARIQRMIFHWMRSCGSCGLPEEDEFTASKPRDSFNVAILRGYVLPDLRKAIQLAPDDFRLIALRTWVTVICEHSSSDESRDGMSESARREAVSGLENLRRLAMSSSSPARSAAIYEVMAMIQITTLRDSAGAAENAALALVMQPERPKAWAVRAAALEESGQTDELIDFLERTLQRTNTVTVRLIRAKVADRSGRPAIAREQVNAAQRLNPDDLRARACDIALRLREPASPEEITRIGESIQDSLGRLGAWEPTSDRPVLSENLGVAVAVHYAFAGEWKQAREVLETVSARHPDSEYIRQISAILAVDPER